MVIYLNEHFLSLFSNQLVNDVQYTFYQSIHTNVHFLKYLIVVYVHIFVLNQYIEHRTFFYFNVNDQTYELNLYCYTTGLILLEISCFSDLKVFLPVLTNTPTRKFLHPKYSGSCVKFARKNMVHNKLNDCRVTLTY